MTTLTRNGARHGRAWPASAMVTMVLALVGSIRVPQTRPAWLKRKNGDHGGKTTDQIRPRLEAETNAGGLQGSQEHGRASQEHGRASQGHGRASQGYGRASQGHGRAAQGHGRASQAHGRASQEHR